MWHLHIENGRFLFLTFKMKVHIWHFLCLAQQSWERVRAASSGCHLGFKPSPLGRSSLGRQSPDSHLDLLTSDVLPLSSGATEAQWLRMQMPRVCGQGEVIVTFASWWPGCLTWNNLVASGRRWGDRLIYCVGLGPWAE